MKHYMLSSWAGGHPKACSLDGSPEPRYLHWISTDLRTSCPPACQPVPNLTHRYAARAADSQQQQQHHRPLWKENAVLMPLICTC